MTIDSTTHYERDLSPEEIEQRKSLTLDLLSERDDNLTTVEEKRREIRALNVSRKKLDARTAQIRREIRSGKVLEPRQINLELGQAELPLKDPDPFGSRYPLARDAKQLRTALRVALQRTPGAIVPSIAALTQWEPSSAAFQAAAHWARVELAHMNASEHPEIELPPRAPMPEQLSELLARIGRNDKPARARREPPPPVRRAPSGKPPSKAGGKTSGKASASASGRRARRG